MRVGKWGGLIFFFSSRRRHTRYWRDWSSDVVLFRSQRAGQALQGRLAVGRTHVRRVPPSASAHHSYAQVSGLSTDVCTALTAAAQTGPSTALRRARGGVSADLVAIARRDHVHDDAGRPPAAARAAGPVLPRAT